MKHIPRAEICTIQDVLYPLRKKADPTWNRKNLEDLKELKEKVNKIKEEKQKILENQPEPFKLKQFRNIPSKFMDTKSWVIKKQQKYLENNQSAENIYIQNGHESKYNKNKVNNIRKELNKSASIKKLPKIKVNSISTNDANIIEEKGNLVSNKNISKNQYLNNELNSKTSINNIPLMNNDIKNSNNNNLNNNEKKFNTINNNDDFNLEKELEKVPLEEGPSIFEKPINNDEEIEKLIKEYKERYGDTEMIRSLIKEFEEMKQKRQARIELEQQLLEEQKAQNNIINQTKEEEKLKDSIQKYEPIIENDNTTGMPVVQESNYTPFLLPKINKNYVRENIRLIVDNKIPTKKYTNIPNNKKLEEKHEYIKKFEQEREKEKQEQMRRKLEKKYPKGTRLLSDEERIKTLNSLKQAQIENSLILEKMPITNRTFKLQQKKDELIRKLNEIDKAIEMFSKKQVFVKKK